MDKGISIARDDDERLAMLLASPYVSEVLQARDDAICAARKSHVDKISALNTAELAQRDTFDDAISTAAAELEVARKAFEKAQLNHSNALYAKSGAIVNFTRERDFHAAELMKTAPKIVADFAADLRQMYQRSLGYVSSRIVTTKKSANSDPDFSPKFNIASDGPDADAWRVAILQAIRDAEHLYLIADFAEIGRRFDELKFSIPDPNTFQIRDVVSPARRK